MQFIENYKKNKAIRTYIEKLPKVLSKDYGRSEYYTPAQVRSSMERAGLMGIYAYYAMVLYCDRPELEPFALQMDAPLDYEAIKTDIADNFFDGNVDFTPKMVSLLTDDYNSTVPFDNFASDDAIDMDGGADG